MDWLTQLNIEALVTAQNCNLAFAVLCLAMAWGMCPRLSGVLAALLYVGMAWAG